MGVCQKNCAIDYSKCLILTFDMFTCSQQEAACALDCLKSAEVEVSVSVWCGRCMDFVAPQAEALIRRKGCLRAEAEGDFDALCGPISSTDMFPKTCAWGLRTGCPTLAKMIE
jgi:hypothetical protein